MITHIAAHASTQQLNAAIRWTADNLHLPVGGVSMWVAVAYICRHFESGQLTGWDGFIQDLEG